MILLKIHTILFVAALLLPYGVQAQISKNKRALMNIYETVQKKNTTSKEIKALTPNINWDKFKNDKEIDERYIITFHAILKNEWRDISFRNVKFSEIEKNKMLVTGTISGIQPAECQVVFHEFQHVWTLKNNELINFSE